MELETKTEFHFSFIADFHWIEKIKKILNNFFFMWYVAEDLLNNLFLSFYDYFIIFTWCKTETSQIKNIESQV